MPTTNVYLNFPGNTEEAFNFYKSAFGGEFGMLMRFKDHPEACKGMLEADINKIMHIALPIGTGNMLMGTDAVEGIGQKLVVGNNMSISLNTDSEQQTDDLFNKLAAGGQVTMPLAKMFWNAYFGMLTDKFGIQWMLNYEYSRAGK